MSDQTNHGRASGTVRRVSPVNVHPSPDIPNPGNSHPSGSPNPNRPGGPPGNNNYPNSRPPAARPPAESPKSAEPPSYGNHSPNDDVLTANLVDTTINDEIHPLTKGKVAFESPLKMGLNETKLVEVRVARHFNQELTTGLATSGEPVVEDITVGPFMSATLTGSAFEIKAVTPENQFIPEDQMTAWRWQVHPTDWANNN